MTGGAPAVSQTPAPRQVARPSTPRSAEHLKLIGAYGGLYRNEVIEAMVGDIVAQLVTAGGLTDRSVRVTILNSPAINAFALPTGDVYVTRGLIALATDESELAAVIAHEIAHVTADHARARARQAEAAALARRVSEVVIDPAVAQDTRETADLSLATFSQQQELEADKLGVETLAKAGFDPFAAARFLKSMADFAALPSLNSATEQKPGFLSSHPSTPARVEHAKRVARQFGAPGIGQRQRTKYLRALNGILYGDDPSEGFVRGREFAHVDLGIAFTVPEGYVLKNTSQAVLATDGEHTAIRFDALGLPENESLISYLKSGWIKGLVEDSVRLDTVNGLPGATASALVEGWSFRIGVVRDKNRIFRFIFASSKAASAYEGAFRRTLSSFRLLSPSQRAAMRPLRVRIVPVRPNESETSLAERMSGVEPAMKLPLFRVLNGLDEHQLTAGDLAKIITE
ncbi:M48 family metalloprotease [Acuticoccus yangtzensis]|uniref:M48 family metalloprotease n=1 Tax=Acuticoccus yangtzensis TaxID=1443441 RepID=UPI0009F7B83D|nr:M48 family metalloprotease [Acuticoccus yangtzensis]ORE92372.1 peptidase, M48 family protein [Stappia sp. 22II-S9-Z10]